MPVTCIVVGCGSRFNRDNIRFFAIPAMSNHRFLSEKNELSRQRREQWLMAIKRGDLTESKLKYERVCSKHFITGRPASLEDKDHPDWVPSQYMGYESQKVRKYPQDVERKERLDKRRKLQLSESASREADMKIDVEEDENESQCTGVSCQTTLSMEQLSVKLEQLSFAAKKIQDLERRIDNSPFGLMDDKSNIDKWKYYTNFNFSTVNFIIYPLMEQYIPTTSTTALSNFNQLLLTLIKLRLDLHFKDLAFQFKISSTTASTYFGTIIDILYKRFKPLIIWPERSVCLINVPSCFEEVFHEKTTVIVDCFEVFIEKPTNLLTQQQCWSNYKHHQTVKFLIGITPQGNICYISHAWGGRASDKQIVEFDNFCKHIKPGDIVLADRGFLIKDVLGVLQAKVVIPAFTKGKRQLHPLEIEETWQIAHVRIHVERVIGLIKNKFNILKGTIPISMLRKTSILEEVNLLDKIVTVCCAFINMEPPIIPL